MGAPGRGVEVSFDEIRWEREVGARFAGEALRVAEARKRLAGEGLRGDQVAHGYEEVGERGVRLSGCVKVYLPLDRDSVSEQDFGAVFELQVDGTLQFVAFGRRHPDRRERSVDERAHRVLHGRFPDRG